MTRTAVITGAGSGLGRDFAILLARRGYHVAICDIDDCDETVAAVRSIGPGIVAAKADVSNPQDVAAFAEMVQREVPSVGVLVNNVGISPYAPFADITLDEWHRVMSVNLDSLFLVTRAFLADLIADGNGRIVNMGSSVCWDPQSTEMAHYATSKLGVVGFTRSLAGELGSYGITVNCIAPGLVRTATLEVRVPEQRWNQTVGRQAVQRRIETEHVAAALDFLVSPAAAAITGVVLPVNGGRVWL